VLIVTVAGDIPEKSETMIVVPQTDLVRPLIGGM
jgi:hypothetical protein